MYFLTDPRPPQPRRRRIFYSAVARVGILLLATVLPSQAQASNCSKFAGTWVWHVEGGTAADIVIAPAGKITIPNYPLLANWVGTCTGDVIIVYHGFGASVRMTLAPDGRKMSGRNSEGNNEMVIATRKTPPPASAAAPSAKHTATPQVATKSAPVPAQVNATRRGFCHMWLEAENSRPVTEIFPTTLTSIQLEVLFRRAMENRGINMSWAICVSEPLPATGIDALRTAEIETATKNGTQVTHLNWAPSPGAESIKLWILNETGHALQVFFDDAHRCAPQNGTSCTLDDIEPGNHRLRLERGDRSTWQSPHMYLPGDIIHCFVRPVAVECSRM